MNRKQLEAAKKAGQTVAYVSYGDRDSDHALEVEVLDTQATRTVHGTSRAEIWGSGHSAPGIRIRHCSPRSEGQEEEVVASQKLVGTWDEYTDLRTLRQERKAQSEARRAGSEAAANEQAARVKAAYTAATGDDPKYWYGKVEVGSNSHYNGQRYTPASRYHVEISPEVLAAILPD